MKKMPAPRPNAAAQMGLGQSVVGAVDVGHKVRRAHHRQQPQHRLAGGALVQLVCCCEHRIDAHVISFGLLQRDLGWIEAIGSVLCRGRGESVHFEQAGGAHAAADAHRHHDVAGPAAASFEECVSDHACARHSVGVADGDRSAVDIDLLGVETEEVAAVQGLRHERLVQFPQVDGRPG